MKSVKCPRCGLVNFAVAPDCKRCHHEFAATAQSVAKPIEQSFAVQNIKQSEPIHIPNQPAQPPLPTATTSPTDAAFEPLPEFEAEATPIGGWLIVFALGLGLSLALSVLGIQKYVNLFSTKEYHELTSSGSRLYISGLSTGAMFEFIWMTVVAATSILLLVRLFRRASSLPRLAIAILSLNIVVAFFDYLMALNVKNELTEKLVALYGRGNVPELLPSYVGWIILYAIVTSVLWIWYFLTSRRVESTFIY